MSEVFCYHNTSDMQDLVWGEPEPVHDVENIIANGKFEVCNVEECNFSL